MTNPDRSEDVERTAKELARAKYVKDKIGPNCPYLWEVLIRANATDMSSHAIRLLLTWATYANEDGTNAFPEYQTIADITGLSVSTLDRAARELKKLGWHDTKRITKRGRSIAFRTIKIPESAMQAITAEILEPSLVKVLKSRKKDSSKVLNPHPCGEGTLTSDGLPTAGTDLSGRRIRGQGDCTVFARCKVETKTSPTRLGSGRNRADQDSGFDSKAAVGGW